MEKSRKCDGWGAALDPEVGDAAAGADQLFNGLKQSGILIKNLNGTHPLLADCLRVTVGTPDENTQFLGALSALLSP